MSTQSIRSEVDDRQLELDRLADDAVVLMEISGGVEQIASSIAHLQARYAALKTAVVVSDKSCSVVDLNELDRQRSFMIWGQKLGELFISNSYLALILMFAAFVYLHCYILPVF